MIITAFTGLLKRKKPPVTFPSPEEGIWGQGEEKGIRFKSDTFFPTPDEK